MKKITTLIIGLLFSVASFSQSFAYKVLKTTTYEYYYDKWYPKDSTYPSQMFFFIDGRKIKVTDRKNSNYYCYGKVETSRYTSHVSYSWKAIDEEQRDCMIIIKKFFDENGNYYDTYTMAVLYSKGQWMVEYECQEDK